MVYHLLGSLVTHSKVNRQALFGLGWRKKANQPLQNVSILTVTEIILDRVVMRGLDLLRRRIINKNKYANVCSVFSCFWYKRDMIDLLTGNEK